MPLNDIYVLPSNYPTFDWSEWPASKAALVQGGLTVNFQKEAWNDIVDQLAAALNAAGLGWDSVYSSIADAKITESPGSLTAAAFNSVRHNIDWPAPLGWKWANDPNFRGYLGRANFRGHSVFGASCDSVYPEYIIELVRKFNLLISIMNGNKALTIAAVEDSLGDACAYGRSGIAARTAADEYVVSKYIQSGIASLMARPFWPVDSVIASAFDIAFAQYNSRVVYPEKQLIHTSFSDNVIFRRFASRLCPQTSLNKTLSEALVMSGCVKSFALSALISTVLDTLLIPAVAYSAGSLSDKGNSLGEASVVNMPPSFAAGVETAISLFTDGIVRSDSLAVNTKSRSTSVFDALIEFMDLSKVESAINILAAAAVNILDSHLRRETSGGLYALGALLSVCSARAQSLQSNAAVVDTMVRMAAVGKAAAIQTGSGVACSALFVDVNNRLSASSAQANTASEKIAGVVDASSNASSAERTVAHGVVNVGGEAAARASDSRRVIHEVRAVHTADATAHSSDALPTVLKQQSIVGIDTEAVVSPSHVTAGNARVISGENVEGNASDSHPGKLRARTISESESDAASSPSVRGKIELLALSGNSAVENASDALPTVMDAEAKSGSNSEAVASPTTQAKAGTEIVSIVYGSVAAASPTVGTRANCEAAALGSFILSPDDVGVVKANNAEARISSDITLKAYRPVGSAARHEATAKLKGVQAVAHTHDGAKADKRIKANHSAALNASIMPAAALHKVVQFDSNSALSKGPTSDAGMAAKAEQTVTARFSAAALRQIAKLKANCRSGLSAVLSFEEVVVDWIYPVQTGNVLLIRQAYDTSLNDNVLSIDAVVAEWSYPVQTGNALLITQVYAAEINDTQLVLD